MLLQRGGPAASCTAHEQLRPRLQRVRLAQRLAPHARVVLTQPWPPVQGQQHVRCRRARHARRAGRAAAPSTRSMTKKWCLHSERLRRTPRHAGFTVYGELRVRLAVTRVRDERKLRVCT